jgi:hypothetical protein
MIGTSRCFLLNGPVDEQIGDILAEAGRNGKAPGAVLFGPGAFF